MPKDGAIETVDTIVAIETVDPTWTDEPIERLSTKGKRKLDLLGPVLVSSPRPKYQHVVTGNALFDAVPLFDPMLDKVCEQSNKALRTPVRKLVLAVGFQPSGGGASSRKASWGEEAKRDQVQSVGSIRSGSIVRTYVRTYVWSRGMRNIITRTSSSKQLRGQSNHQGAQVLLGCHVRAYAG